MATTVRLTVLTGPHKERKYSFSGPTHCLVGRGADCSVQFSGMPQDQSISRHHCQLDIDPPWVRVQDLGSLNGTYVNGKKVGPGDFQRTDVPPPPADAVVLNDGDLLSLDGTTLRVDFLASPPQTCPHDANGCQG